MSGTLRKKDWMRYCFNSDQLSELLMRTATVGNVVTAPSILIMTIRKQTMLPIPKSITMLMLMLTTMRTTLLT